MTSRRTLLLVPRLFENYPVLLSTLLWYSVFTGMVTIKTGQTTHIRKKYIIFITRYEIFLFPYLMKFLEHLKYSIIFNYGRSNKELNILSIRTVLSMGETPNNESVFQSFIQQFVYLFEMSNLARFTKVKAKSQFSISGCQKTRSARLQTFFEEIIQCSSI